MKKFELIFFSVILGTLVIVVGAYIHSQRPKFKKVKTFTNEFQYVKASGKCVECHRRETGSIVHQFEMSKHASANLNCLDCHQALDGQQIISHKGFSITKDVTAKNCASCHKTEYDQFSRSRHAAPAWAAVRGEQDFTVEQIRYSEQYHPGTVIRPSNALSLVENKGTVEKGCMGCHSIGQPNLDGSIGSCTECHSKHNPSIEMARKPTTCAQCHMGPDHSQFEIYSESKHGAMLSAHNDKINYGASSKKLTTKDFFVPTCATCHMSGLEGMKVTHDTTERLSLFLYAPVSEKRPHFQQGRDQMKEVCLKCHTQNNVDKFYQQGDLVVLETNKTVKEANTIIAELKNDGVIDKKPFNEEIEFLAFDLWHYYGRTAKHGAFMGGADFVQWHGNYELIHKMVKLKKQAHELRVKH